MPRRMIACVTPGTSSTSRAKRERAARPAHVVEPAVAADARVHHRDRRASLPWARRVDELVGIAQVGARRGAGAVGDRVAERDDDVGTGICPPPRSPESQGRACVSARCPVARAWARRRDKLTCTSLPRARARSASSLQASAPAASVSVGAPEKVRLRSVRASATRSPVLFAIHACRR